jgi:hypothetical protein
MREFMKIVEGFDPLAAQALYDKALRVSKALSTAHYEFRAHWNREWVETLKASIEAARAKHEESEAERAAWEAEDAAEMGTQTTFVQRSFNVTTEIHDVLAGWWETMDRDFGYTLSHDVKQAIDYYHRAHPMAESSDEMSLLHSEKELATAISIRGGFGGFHGMDIVLTQMDSFAHALDTFRDISGSICTPSTEKAIKAGIPLILYAATVAGATAHKSV